MARWLLVVDESGDFGPLWGTSAFARGVPKTLVAVGGWLVRNGADVAQVVAGQLRNWHSTGEATLVAAAESRSGDATPSEPGDRYLNLLRELFGRTLDVLVQRGGAHEIEAHVLSRRVYDGQLKTVIPTHSRMLLGLADVEGRARRLLGSTPRLSGGSSALAASGVASAFIEAARHGRTAPTPADRCARWATEQAAEWVSAMPDGDYQCRA